MFRQYISKLPFYPTLIEEGKYFASRFRKELKLRRNTAYLLLSIIFLLLVLISPIELQKISNIESSKISGLVEVESDSHLRSISVGGSTQPVLVKPGNTVELVLSRPSGDIEPFDISPILNYSNLLDAPGATLSSENKLSWGNTSTNQHTVLLQIKNPLPNTVQSIELEYGNNLTIILNENYILKIIDKLPQSAPLDSILLLICLLSVTFLFFLQSKTYLLETTVLHRIFSESRGIETSTPQSQYKNLEHSLTTTLQIIRPEMNPVQVHLSRLFHIKFIEYCTYFLSRTVFRALPMKIASFIALLWLILLWINNAEVLYLKTFVSIFIIGSVIGLAIEASSLLIQNRKTK